MIDQKGDSNISSVIGVVLIFVILIGFSIYQRPTTEQIEAARKQQDSIAASAMDKPKAQDSISSEAGLEKQNIAADFDSEIQQYDSTAQDEIMAKYGRFALSASGKEQLFIIENELIKVTLTNKGGRIKSVEIKKYSTSDSLPLYLFNGDSNVFNLNFFSDNKNIATNDLYFINSGGSFDVKGKNFNTLSMRLYASEYDYLEYQYSLTGNSYVVGLKINFHGLQDVVSSNTNYLALDWNVYGPRQEKSLSNERINSTIYYRYYNDEVDYLSESSDETKDLKTKVKWVAFKQQFFSSILFAETSFFTPTSITTLTDNSTENQVKHFKAAFTIPFGHQREESFPMSWYFGPNHYKTLKEFDLGFEKVIPLGWGIFGWMNQWLIIPVFNFLGRFISSYGIIILILTIIIKILLFPLMYKSYLSTAKMGVLKPEIAEIGAKFPKKEDAMKKQQAVMAMYKKAGVNPLGGCLPMLVQFPILIAMYRFFPASIELRQQKFLWADDLSSYDSIYDFPNGFSIPFYGDHVSLFTLLMTAATLMSVKMNTEMSGNSQMQMPQMKIMMYLMPIMFLGFFNDFASALSYYYFIATMFTFGQQYVMKRFVDHDAILKKIQENKKKPPAKKSGFQKRIEKMAQARGYKP